MGKKLIAFYSRADENYVNGMLKHLETGNTEIVANYLQQITGADLFKIEQKEPYAKGYNDCIAQAQEDQRQGKRPELVRYPEQIEQYDEIYLGYPNYWGSMPMAVFTFLEHADFSGKVIKPFCTHEGSGMGNSVRDIQKLCPQAQVEKGIAIYGSRAKQSQKDLEQWA